MADGQSVCFSVQAPDLVLEWIVMVLHLLGVLSDERTGLSLVSCHSYMFNLVRSLCDKLCKCMYIALHDIIYNIYKKSLILGFQQQIMPYFV
jgi:hypothetical protein